MFGAISATIALSLTGIAVACKRTVIFVGAAFSWGVLSFWAYTSKTTFADIYFILFLFCIGMMIALTIEAFIQWFEERNKEQKAERKQEVIDAKATVKEQQGLHPADKLRLKHGLPPSNVRARHQNNVRTGWQ